MTHVKGRIIYLTTLDDSVAADTVHHVKPDSYETLHSDLESCTNKETADDFITRAKALASELYNEWLYPRSYKRAVKEWNTRAERTCHWVYFDDSVSTPDFHEDDWHLECSACGFDPESIIGPNVDNPECLSCFVHCPSCGARVIS